jgi:hypothetical protein
MTAHHTKPGQSKSAGQILMMMYRPRLYTCAHLAPPPDFDPFSATPEELEKYGYPPKPTDPERLETWSEIVSVPIAPIPDGAVFTLVPNDPLPRMAPGQKPP